MDFFLKQISSQIAILQRAQMASALLAQMKRILPFRLGTTCNCRRQIFLSIMDSSSAWSDFRSYVRASLLAKTRTVTPDSSQAFLTAAMSSQYKMLIRQWRPDPYS
ncbi:hypothetical protein N7499_000580 [Penicillium canescens]|uniref:Uncharacterized protein n=1 Tax=Penicillium canescens TaxID=5083 RepID=A0AAD6IH36_PENCN|nr:hypothetical protein N7460_004009 [Penicillium canescens]KAJ6100950.1 hypothetical protein N7499_000580 [Penicillium canescens]